MIPGLLFEAITVRRPPSRDGLPSMLLPAVRRISGATPAAMRNQQAGRISATAGATRSFAQRIERLI